jgi:hypothetical protein
MKYQLVAVLLGTSIVGGPLVANESMSGGLVDKARHISSVVQQAVGGTSACDNNAQRINVITPTDSPWKSLSSLSRPKKPQDCAWHTIKALWPSKTW